tara:strand:+ start:1080 stop:1868 length:789 start_codon:yes stop_codon:yes gene_type:complete
MSQSLVNSFEGTILAGGNFTGGKEVINGAISIICALYTTTNLTIETYQSADNINYYSFSSFVHDVAIYGTHTRTQFYIEGRWGYIKVSNNTGGNATGVLFSTLYSANNHDGTIQQPTYIQGNVSVTSLSPITGAFSITSQSRNTSSITTYENNSSIISFNLITTILPVKQIKGSAGSLVSLIAYNDSNLVNFILIYDLLPINVSVGVSTPIAVIALKKTDVSQVPIHSVLFSNAISFVISGSFNGSIQPHGSGVYITALYDN